MPRVIICLYLLSLGIVYNRGVIMLLLFCPSVCLSFCLLHLLAWSKWLDVSGFHEVPEHITPLLLFSGAKDF